MLSHVNATAPAVIDMNNTATNSEIGTAQTASSLDPKEVKKLSKRIMKAAQGPLNEAVDSEAVLARKPSEEIEPLKLEAIVEQLTRAQLESNSKQEASALNGTRIAESDSREYNFNGIDDDGQEHEASLQLVKEMSESEIARRAASGSEALDHSHLNNSSEKTDEAVIRLKINSDTTLPIGTSNPVVNEGDIKEDTRAEDAPTLSCSGSTLPSTSNPEPSTPQQNEKDWLAPLRLGGIPWYAETFDPDGTTICDERWTGPDVLRGLSEELSEMDEDEINELVDQDMEDVPTKAAPLVVPTPSSKGKKRRKARAYY